MKTYTKAVSATLAGALAVGMVPAMAFAADDSVELQAATDPAVIQAGTITMFAGGANPATEFVKGEAESIKAIVPITVEEGGATEGVEYNVCEYRWVKIDPTAVADGGKDEVVVGGKAVVVADSLNASGEPNYTYGTNGNSLPTDTGNYAIFAKALVDDEDKDGVEDKGADTAHWVTNGAVFSIVPKAITGELAFYEIATVDGEVVTADTTHVFKDEVYYIEDDSTPTEGWLGISVDGEALEAGADYTFDNFSVKDVATNQDAKDRKAAGEYYVEANFNGVYKKVYYDIEKFDVATADIELVSTVASLAEVSSDFFQIASVNDNAGNSKNMVKIAKNSVDFDSADLKPGEYTVTVGLADSYAKNASVVAGSTQDIKVTVVGQVIDGLKLTYPLGTDKIEAADDDASAVTTDDYAVNRSAADYTAAKEFDVSKLIVTDANNKVYTNIKPVVSKKNVYGEYVECDPSELTDGSWGEYQVKAVLVDSTYATAGETAAIEVSITNGAIQNADVAFAYKNDNVTTDEYKNAPLTYSGADFLDDLNVVVKCNGKAVPASDYTLIAQKLNTKTGKYEACESVVDQGTYKIFVESSKYDVDDNEINVVIDVVDVWTYRADQITAKGYAGKEFLYTGEAVNPIDFFAEYDATSKDKVKYVNGEAVILDVPASAYKITITEFIPEGDTKPVLKKDLPTDFVEPGTYTWSIADAPVKAGEPDNYDIVERGNLVVEIVSDSVFPDVASDAWYADEVLAVAQAGWITGYSNGNFGPNDGMKRGDLALVLARYLKLTNPYDAESDGSLEAENIQTGFADVKGTAYYAWAVKAMAEAGVITGYGDGTYGAEDLVTREQLATILARLDESGLGDASILASALDAYADGDEVAVWAVAGVEWAVESGVMGVDTQFLNPGDDVTRAEVAAMILRYDAL